MNTKKKGQYLTVMKAREEVQETYPATPHTAALFYDGESP